MKRSIRQTRGRGRARKTIELLAAATRILNEIHPCSVRAVCYRLFAEGYIDSMEKTNTNRVSNVLRDAREDGEVPWDWVVDETREAERVQSWRDIAEFVGAVKRSYRRDYWSMQPNRVEVFSEKGTVRGTLAPVLDTYGVTFRVMHGFGSATAVHDVAEESARWESGLIALYVGDWDPSGMYMSEVDLPQRLERYGGQVELIRIAVAKGDTRPEAEVPSFSVHEKRGDARHDWFLKHYGERCFEVDAVNPVTLRDRIEREIQSRLDVDAWNHAIDIEKAEIDSMVALIGQWPTSISGLASK